MDHLINELVLTAGGVLSGILAGLLGAGGGVICLPLMLALNYTPIQALATGCLAVSIIAVSGSIQNSRMGYFSLERVIYIGIPALIMTPVSTYAVSQIEPYLLLLTSGTLMLLLIYLARLRKQLVAKMKQAVLHSQAILHSQDTLIYARKSIPDWLASNAIKRIATGSIAGLFAGALSGGSGTLLVPLQMLILGEGIKVAIQTSIGVNIITSAAAWISHASRGNVLFAEGFLLGIGGFVGAQIGTRCLPKLPDKAVNFAFDTLVISLSTYIFWKAWRSYQGF